MTFFDVNVYGRDVELIPDFFISELSDSEKREYDELLERLDFEFGALHLEDKDNVFQHGTRLSIKEVKSKLTTIMYIDAYDNAMYIRFGQEPSTRGEEMVKELFARSFTHDSERGYELVNGYSGVFDSGDEMTVEEAFFQLFDFFEETGMNIPSVMYDIRREFR